MTKTRTIEVLSLCIFFLFSYQSFAVDSEIQWSLKDNGKLWKGDTINVVSNNPNLKAEVKVVDAYRFSRLSILVKEKVYFSIEKYAIHWVNWSQDCSKLACTASDDIRTENSPLPVFIFTLDVKKKELKKITKPNYQCKAPLWSNDGKFIVYFGQKLDAPIKQGLFIMTADGKKLDQLTFYEELSYDFDIPLRWSDDLKTLTYRMERFEGTSTEHSIEIKKLP